MLTAVSLSDNITPICFSCRRRIGFGQRGLRVCSKSLGSQDSLIIHENCIQGLITFLISCVNMDFVKCFMCDGEGCDKCNDGVVSTVVGRPQTEEELEREAELEKYNREAWSNLYSKLHKCFYDADSS